MKKILLCSFILGSFSLFAQDKPVVLPKDVQIKMALQFLTEEEQNHANVLGYNEQAELIVLDDKDGYLTCVADDPNKKGVEVVCYHSELADFMQRGRDLRAEGKSFKDIFEIRGNEIEAEKLYFPKGQSMLYVFTGKDDNLNPTTGILKDGFLRFVVYMPFATQATTGLPTTPTQAGMPWLMDAGTYHAHIMMTPAK